MPFKANWASIFENHSFGDFRQNGGSFVATRHTELFSASLSENGALSVIVNASAIILQK